MASQQPVHARVQYTVKVIRQLEGRSKTRSAEECCNVLADLAEVLRPRDRDAACTYALSVVQDALAPLLASAGPVFLSPYGSYVSGLRSPTSDLDIALTGVLSSSFNFRREARSLAVDTPVERLSRYHVLALLKIIEFEVANAGIADGIEAVPGAKVPLLKFTERHSRVEVDFSVSCRVSADFKDQIMRHVCSIDERVPQLMRLVKQWSRVHGLNDPQNGTFNSFSLRLMVLFSLQTCDLLPDLASLLGMKADDARPLEVPGFDFDQCLADCARRCAAERAQRVAKAACAADGAGGGTTHRETLLQLLQHFLSLYDALLECWDIDPNFSDWRVCVWRGGTGHVQRYFQPYLVLVEDPFDSCENTARSLGSWTMSSKSRVEHVRQVLRQSAAMICNVDTPEDASRACAWLFGPSGLSALPEARVSCAGALPHLGALRDHAVAMHGGLGQAGQDSERCLASELLGVSSCGSLGWYHWRLPHHLTLKATQSLPVHGAAAPTAALQAQLLATAAQGTPEPFAAAAHQLHHAFNQAAHVVPVRSGAQSLPGTQAIVNGPAPGYAHQQQQQGQQQQQLQQQQQQQQHLQQPWGRMDARPEMQQPQGGDPAVVLLRRPQNTSAVAGGVIAEPTLHSAQSVPASFGNGDVSGGGCGRFAAHDPQPLQARPHGPPGMTQDPIQAMRAAGARGLPGAVIATSVFAAALQSAGIHCGGRGDPHGSAVVGVTADNNTVHVSQQQQQQQQQQPPLQHQQRQQNHGLRQHYSAHAGLDAQASHVIAPQVSCSRFSFANPPPGFSRGGSAASGGSVQLNEGSSEASAASGQTDLSIAKSGKGSNNDQKGGGGSPQLDDEWLVQPSGLAQRSENTDAAPAQVHQPQHHTSDLRPIAPNQQHWLQQHWSRDSPQQQQQHAVSVTPSSFGGDHAHQQNWSCSDVGLQQQQQAWQRQDGGHCGSEFGQSRGDSNAPRPHRPLQLEHSGWTAPQAPGPATVHAQPEIQAQQQVQPQQQCEGVVCPVPSQYQMMQQQHTEWGTFPVPRYLQSQLDNVLISQPQGQHQHQELKHPPGIIMCPPLLQQQQQQQYESLRSVLDQQRPASRSGSVSSAPSSAAQQQQRQQERQQLNSHGVPSHPPRQRQPLKLYRPPLRSAQQLDANLLNEHDSAPFDTPHFLSRFAQHDLRWSDTDTPAHRHVSGWGVDQQGHPQAPGWGADLQQPLQQKWGVEQQQDLSGWGVTQAPPQQISSGWDVDRQPQHQSSGWGDEQHGQETSSWGFTPEACQQNSSGWDVDQQHDCKCASDMQQQQHDAGRNGQQQPQHISSWGSDNPPQLQQRGTAAAPGCGAGSSQARGQANPRGLPPAQVGGWAGDSSAKGRSPRDQQVSTFQGREAPQHHSGSAPGWGEERVAQDPGQASGWDAAIHAAAHPPLLTTKVSGWGNKAPQQAGGWGGHASNDRWQQQDSAAACQHTSGRGGSTGIDRSQAVNQAAGWARDSEQHQDAAVGQGSDLQPCQRDDVAGGEARQQDQAVSAAAAECRMVDPSRQGKGSRGRGDDLPLSDVAGGADLSPHVQTSTWG